MASCRARATSNTSRPPSGSKSSGFEVFQGLQRLLGPVKQAPDQAPLGRFQRRRRPRRPEPGTSFAVTSVRRLTAAFRISARTTSSVIRARCAMRSRELIAGGRVRNPRRHAEHAAQELSTPLVVAEDRDPSAA